MLRIKASIFFVTRLFLASILTAQASDFEPLIVTGLLLDDNANPVEGAQIQIWQTDPEGIYDHPLSTLGGACDLDSNFQYYGTATTASDGNYTFFTARPGRYAFRPKIHIHFRVWVDDELEHTSQFYFADDGQEDTSGFSSTIVISPESNDVGGQTAIKNIVIDLGGGGTEEITATQPAGPFYPLDDFFDDGNDLILNNGRRMKSGLRGKRKANDLMQNMISRWG